MERSTAPRKTSISSSSGCSRGPPMPIRMKVYHQGKETLVAAADADLIGKTFREGKFKIEVGKFYVGDVVSEETFLYQLTLAPIGNCVGAQIVDAGMRAGSVSD